MLFSIRPMNDNLFWLEGEDGHIWTSNFACKLSWEYKLKAMCDSLKKKGYEWDGNDPRKG